MKLPTPFGLDFEIGGADEDWCFKGKWGAGDPATSIYYLVSDGLTTIVVPHSVGHMTVRKGRRTKFRH